jgi:mono/diheme cytochrome c family protein
MLFALSRGHEIGLAVMGGLFIAFALISSFLFPRSNPDFPGKGGLRWYLPVAFCFFIAMLAAVIVFGRAEPEATASSPPASTSTTPSSTTTTPAGASGNEPSAPYNNGNAAAGKTVFTSAGCSACHTFTPAGAKGTIGPDLDHLSDYAKMAGVPLGDYTVDAIINPPAKYVPPGFPTNAMPTTFKSSLTTQQIADVSAFLIQGQQGG